MLYTSFTKAACILCRATRLGFVRVFGNNKEIVKVEILPTVLKALSPKNELASEFNSQLDMYFANPKFSFDLPFSWDGTDFRRRVWSEILQIPVGKTVTYGRLATLLGSSPRAVGRACGDNQLLLLVPCHRVVGKNHIGGFMGSNFGQSLDPKRWLIQHETGVR